MGKNTEPSPGMTRTQGLLLAFVIVMNLLFVLTVSHFTAVAYPEAGWSEPFLIGFPFGVGLGLCDAVVLISLFGEKRC